MGSVAINNATGLRRYRICIHRTCPDLQIPEKCFRKLCHGFIPPYLGNLQPVPHTVARLFGNLTNIASPKFRSLVRKDANYNPKPTFSCLRDPTEDRIGTRRRVLLMVVGFFRPFFFQFFGQNILQMFFILYVDASLSDSVAESVAVFPGSYIIILAKSYLEPPEKIAKKCTIRTGDTQWTSRCQSRSCVRIFVFRVARTPPLLSRNSVYFPPCVAYTKVSIIWRSAPVASPLHGFRIIYAFFRVLGRKFAHMFLASRPRSVMLDLLFFQFWSPVT